MMFELICMSLLSAAYINACINESKEKNKQKIRDLKISIFCYAIRHNLSYEKVVELIKNQIITFEDIKKDAMEYERK